ncbi:MAG: carbonic anhydrase [Spirochaetia bacterium]|nr:carbonic anhydrase [Spirochaetia bacterium]
MARIQAVNNAWDIPEAYRDTPFSLLLEYHNLGRPFDTYSKADLLIGMCMDSRKHLIIPDNFAFIIRSGGANLRPAEFKVSYAIAVGGVRHIALISHSNCGMVGLAARREQFVDGLVDAGWKRERAEEHFMGFAPLFEIGNEMDFVVHEAHRLRQRYPRVKVAPFHYKVEDNRIYLINDDE